MPFNSAGFLFKVTFAGNIHTLKSTNFTMAPVGAGSARPIKPIAFSVLCYLAKAPPLVYEGRWMKPLGFRRRGGFRLLGFITDAASESRVKFT